MAAKTAQYPRPLIAQSLDGLWRWKCLQCNMSNRIDHDTADEARPGLERHYGWAHTNPMPEPYVRPY